MLGRVESDARLLDLSGLLGPESFRRERGTVEGDGCHGDDEDGVFKQSVWMREFR